MPQNRRSASARPFRILTQSIAALASTMIFAPVAQAASLYWDGTTAGWDAIANWSTDPAAPIPDPLAVPGAADLAIFNISTINDPETVSLNAAQAALGLVFNNTGTTALQGGSANQTLTLGASGILLNAGAGAVTIGSATAGQNVALTLGAAQAWTNNAASLLTVTNGVTNGGNLLTVNGTGNTAIAGVIGGTGGITKSGAGLLTLSATNTYTGITTVSAGTLRATAAGSLGANTTATALTLAGGTVQLGNDTATTFGRNTTVTASSVIVSDRATAGAGVTHTLGTLSIGAQTLTISKGVSVTSGTAGVTFGATTLTGAATLSVDTGAQLTLGAVTNGANLLTVTGAGNTSITGIVGAGAGGITMTGNGLLTLSGVNTYTGITTISAGNVRATVAASLGASTAANAVTLAGGTLQLGNDAATTFGRNTTVTATSTIASDRATAGAGVTHTMGTLSIGAQTLNVTRGALATSGTGTVAFGATTLTGAPTFAPATGAQLNITGIVSGAFGLTKDGAGIVALSGANTFTGVPTVANGTLRASNAAALGTNATVTVLQALTGGGQGNTLDLTGTITIGAGKTLTLNSNGTGDLRSTLLNSANNNTWAGTIVAAGTGLTQLNAASGTTLTITGPVTSTDTGTLFTRGAGTVVYNGVLTLGPRFFNHTDAGTVIVNSTGNTWASSTVSNGQIQIGATNALPNVDFNFGQTGAGDGRFELNGFNQTVAGMRTIATSTSVSHVLRNSNRTTPSTLTFSTAAATTDTLKNTHVQGIGSLTVVKNDTGRFELQDVRLENAAWVVNAGTLAFTGTSTQIARPNITGLLAATIEKSGTGTTTLLGNYNHAGATLISGGRLNFASGTAGAITVADGTTMGAGFAGGSLTSGPLTFGSVANSTFAPNLTTPAGAALITTSNLTANGTAVIVTPTGANIVPGTYPLIGYGGGSINGGGFGAFSLGAPGTYPHMAATLVDNAAQGRVDLSVTAVDSLVWTGATGVWDINTTANFKKVSDGLAANFFQGDRVLFDDTGTTKAIAITGAPIIGNLVFNNSTGAANDYTITGALTGPGGITKNNTGTTTLATASSFTGPVNVTDGVLVLGGANTGSGDVTVSGGTLRLGNADAISTANSVTITPGGTLDVNGTAPNVKIQHIHVSGAGVGGNGAIVNNGAGITNNNHAFTITLDGDTTWGGSGRYDVNNTLINGGSFTLTKKGTAELAYQPAAGSTLGNVIVDGGTFTAQTNNPLATTSNVTINSGAIHQFFSAISVQHSATLNDGGILRSSNSTPTFNGTITLNGTTPGRNIQATTGTTLNVAGRITGTGGFTMADVGTVQIRNATNDYLGDTVLTSGTLNFDTVGKLPVTTNLNINGGTFDPVNRTHTVGSLAGTSGQINQATAGTGVLITTQSTTTTFTANLNRVALQMDGSGSLTLGGSTDNSGGTAVVNNGTLVLAKSGGDYGVHTVGSGNLGLVINGGTLQIGGNPLTLFTGGSASNNPPADIPIASPPSNYVDQIFNLTEVQLNTGGTLDLNGRIEAIDGLAGGGTITNTSATPGRLYVGYNNNISTSPGFLGNTSNFSGVIQNGASSMELRKIGTGTVILSGANTYTGATTVTAGTLQVTGSLGSTPVTVASGATLSGSGPLGGSVTIDGTFAGGGNVAGGIAANTGSIVNVGGNTSGGAATTISTSSLTFTAGTRTVNIDFTGTAADRIITTNANGLSLSGTSNVTVLLGSSGWVTGSFPIYSYAGTLQGTGAGSLVLASAAGHNAVAFADDGLGNVNMNITATTNKWVGGTAVWDINTTSNWNAADGKFLNGDNVLFDNTATNFNPTLATGVAPTPAAVVFDNSTAYTLSGLGGISGTGRLTKRNSGSLTLSNPNTYTGNTVVEGGTLIANFNNGTATTVISAASQVDIATGAVLRAIANDSDFTWANTVTGSGTLAIDPHATADAGARAVTMSGNLNGFTGTLNLTPTTGTNGFRLAVDNVADLGAATVNVSNGGQVFVSANSLTFPNNMTISGTGYFETAGRLGAIRAANPSTFTGVITINGTAKIGAHAGVANITNSITGGTLTFGGNNNASAEVLNLSGDASGLAALIVNDGTATANAANITFNVGIGGTTGTLGNVPVTVTGDGFKTGILRFDRSNGYTLGGAITAGGTAARTIVDLDVLGTGFSNNGLAINLGTPAAGGLVRIGVARANAVASFTGAVSGASLQIGVGAAMTGAVANLNSGANVNVNQIDVALGATNATLNIAPGATVAVGAGGFFLGQQSTFASTVNQSGGDVTVGNRLQIGHWPSETSTYNVNGGTIIIANTNTVTSPSGTAEQTGGIYIGIDGTGIVNQTNGTVTTDWVVLDNRGDTAGVDQYNLSGGVLAVRMNHGIIRRNATAEFNFTGGTIRNAGSGVAMAIAAPLKIGTGGVGTPTLDTNGATNSIVVSQSMTGAGALTKAGSGTLNLDAGSAAWTGNFDLTAGTVAVSAADGGLGSFTTAGRSISASNAGTISFTINNVFGNGAANPNLPSIALNSGSTLTTTRYNTIGALTLNGSTLTSAHGTADADVYQSWQLKGAVTVGGSSPSTFAGTGTFPGVHLDANTTFNISDATNSASSDLVVSVPLLNQSADFGGTGGLTKSGGGTMEIASGVSAPYTGATTISAGALLVNGDISGSAVSILGGMLAGSGATGSILVDGGTLAPSNPLDPLNTGSLTFDGGTYAIGITGAGLNGQSSVLGSIAFTSNTALTLDFSTYDPVEQVDTFTLLLNDGADLVSLGGSAFTFGGNPLTEGSTFTASSGAFTQQFRISYAGGSGNDVVLSAVPEPTSAALLLGGLASLVGMRRSRRRS